jgi:hypothetical protein
MPHPPVRAGVSAVVASVLAVDGRIFADRIFAHRKFADRVFANRGVCRRRLPARQVSGSSYAKDTAVTSSISLIMIPLPFRRLL